VAQLLRDRLVPVHHTELSATVLPVLGYEGVMSSHAFYTCLYDDPEGRFIPTGRGRWQLRT
jgi:DNA-directed RNA polymerase delta subunit